MTARRGRRAVSPIVARAGVVEELALLTPEDRAWVLREVGVVACVDSVLALDEGEPGANAYGGGRLRWFGGANGGLESAIAVSAGAMVTLREPPGFVPEASVLVMLSEGCDKSLATCAARFGNAVNFRGEPYLPGVDLLTRYPGG